MNPDEKETHNIHAQHWSADDGERAAGNYLLNIWPRCVQAEMLRLLKTVDGSRKAENLHFLKRIPLLCRERQSGKMCIERPSSEEGKAWEICTTSVDRATPPRPLFPSQIQVDFLRGLSLDYNFGYGALM